MTEEKNLIVTREIKCRGSIMNVTRIDITRNDIRNQVGKMSANEFIQRYARQLGHITREHSFLQLHSDLYSADEAKAWPGRQRV